MTSPEANSKQIEELRNLNPRYLRFITGMISLGLMYGSAEAAIWYQDAQTVLAESADESKPKDPPKPPRRPNAKIDGIALGNT
jgi:hypothetical protein